MHLFSKICKDFKKICNYYALMQIRFIKEIIIIIIFNFFPLNKCFYNCIFLMRIKLMQES